MIATIAPLATFAKKVGGDRIEVVTLVPAGADPHSWAPTPRQVDAVAQAEIWFRLGEIGEMQLLRAAEGRGLSVVDVREGIDLIYDPGHYCAHCAAHHSGADQHIWLSPRNAKIISEEIAAALAAHYPEWKEEFESNLQEWLVELKAADEKISASLEGMSCRTLMTSHAAYAYFARDYNLRQISVESSGKEPTPQQLIGVIKEAREAGVRCIFVQPETSPKGAMRVAEAIGAEIRIADPLAPDYIGSLLELTHDLRECSP